MGEDILAVLAATVGMFAFGAIWYTPLFGKLWGKMNGFYKLTKAEQKAAMSKMGPTFALQFLVTILTAYVLAWLIDVLPGYSAYTLAGLLWIGLIVPTQISNVLFGRIEDKWKIKMVGVQAFGSLGCLLVGAVILSLFK